MRDKRPKPFRRTMVYFLEVLIPLVVLVLLTNVVALSILQQREIDKVRYEINSSADALAMYLRQIENLAFEVATNAQIQEMATNNERYNTTPRAQSQAFDSIMGLNRFYNLNIICIQVKNSALQSCLSVGFVQIEAYEMDEEFAMGSQFGEWVLSGSTNYYNWATKPYNIISFYQRMYKGTSQNSLGFVRIDIDERIISDLYRPDNNMDLIELYLIKKPDTLFSMSGGARPLTEIQNAAGFEIISREVNDCFTLVCAVDRSMILPRNNYLYQVIYISVTFVVVLSFVAYRFIRRVIRPLKQLSSATENPEKTDASQLSPPLHNAEMTAIFASFNRMVERQQEASRQAKLAQTLYLQSQINPHFLYNTLDSLRWLALKNNDVEVSREIYNLSRLFRYYLNQTDTFVHIREEVDLIHHYMAVQRVRFPEKFTFTVHMDPLAADLYTPKILLQPLVENAVLHAFDDKEENCQIMMRIRRHGESVWVHVWDNGCGMDAKQVDMLNHNLEYTNKSFAITNIRRRLQLYFDDGFSLHFISSKSTGTLIRLRFPVITDPSPLEEKI